MLWSILLPFALYTHSLLYSTSYRHGCFLKKKTVVILSLWVFYARYSMQMNSFFLCMHSMVYRALPAYHLHFLLGLFSPFFPCSWFSRGTLVDETSRSGLLLVDWSVAKTVFIINYNICVCTSLVGSWWCTEAEVEEELNNDLRLHGGIWPAWFGRDPLERTSTRRENWDSKLRVCLMVLLCSTVHTYGTFLCTILWCFMYVSSFVKKVLVRDATSISERTVDIL